MGRCIRCFEDGGHSWAECPYSAEEAAQKRAAVYADIRTANRDNTSPPTANQTLASEQVTEPTPAAKPRRTIAPPVPILRHPPSRYRRARATAPSTRTARTDSLICTRRPAVIGPTIIGNATTRRPILTVPPSDRISPTNRLYTVVCGL